MRYIYIFLILCQALWADAEILSFVTAAKGQVGVTKSYNPRYQRISYPNGDVDIMEGVCTDVIIRGLRPLGIDLQKNIHEDMTKHFNLYPKKWRLTQPDSNIDHRRVPNMATYFQRQGLELLQSNSYIPGDIIIWDLGSGLWHRKGTLHVGVVSSQYDVRAKRYKIIHNICCGVKEEDFLNDYPILHHFRLTPEWIKLHQQAVVK